MTIGYHPSVALWLTNKLPLGHDILKSKKENDIKKEKTCSSNTTAHSQILWHYPLSGVCS